MSPMTQAAADPLADETGERLRAILAEHAMVEPGEVTPSSTLESLGMDSLGLMESIFAIEEAFDISVPFNANVPGESEFDISSVATMAEAIRRLRAAQA